MDDIQEGIEKDRFACDVLGHLSEKEIRSAAEDCFGSWGEDQRGRDAVTMLRIWLKQGMKSGAVRKASKPSRKQEVTFTEPDNPMQVWHNEAARLFPHNVYQTYFRPAEWDGNGTLFVAKSFHADYIKSRFSSELKTLFPDGVELITKPQKEKELVN